MAEGVTRSPRGVPAAGLPRHDQARFRRRASLILVLALTLGAVAAAYATANSRLEFPPVIVAVGVIPLLGSVVGAMRLVAAWAAGPSRSHAILAAFSLGLLSWSIAVFAYLIARARGSALLEFPSFVDVPNYLSAVFWTIGVWLLYEGAVDDFLDEVHHNSYFLTLIAVGCFFVLTIAEGNDYGKLLWSGNDLAKHVTEGLLPLALGVNGFLLFRTARGKFGKRLQVDRKALRAIAFGLSLAAVSDLLVAAGSSIGARDPTSVLAYRNGGLADVLALVSYFWLAFGVLHFPLESPLFQQNRA